MWSISASVSRTAGHRGGADAVRAVGGEPLELLAQVRRGVDEEPRALRPADGDRRLRARARRGARCGPPRTSGSGSSTGGTRRRRPNRGSGRAPGRWYEQRDDPPMSGRADPGRHAMDVEVTAAEPADVEADVLAVAAGGPLVRRARRALRRAAGARGGGRGSGGGRARRRASCARGASPWSRSTGVDAEDLRTAAARAVRAQRGGGTVAWALDDALPLDAGRARCAALVEGAVLGGYDAGRWKSGAPRPRRRALRRLRGGGRARSASRRRAPSWSRAGRTSRASSSTRRRTSSRPPGSPSAPPRCPDVARRGARSGRRRACRRSRRWAGRARRRRG